MKNKETLEEAKVKHGKFCIENNIENPIFSFDNGAKWQQENSYSEEEVINILVEFTIKPQNVWNITEWVKQFKKK